MVYCYSIWDLWSTQFEWKYKFQAFSAKFKQFSAHFPIKWANITILLVYLNTCKTLEECYEVIFPILVNLKVKYFSMELLQNQYIDFTYQQQSTV